MESLHNILILTLIWYIQASMSAVINAISQTRIPTSIKDFMLLTFLPYIVWCKLFNPEKLK